MKVGIVGAGQLGGFLCQAAREVGLSSAVLAKSEADGARRFADQSFLSNFGDAGEIDALIEWADVVTFELEDVSAPMLERLDASSDTEVYPQPSVMRILQNKALQKDWLAERGYPLPSYRRLDEGLRSLDQVSDFAGGYVIKTQRGGYDGLGVYVADEGELPDAYRDVPVVVERLLKEFSEIAVLVARDRAGNTEHYPVFESEFNEGGNVLSRVYSPARIDEALAERAIDMAVKVVGDLAGVGLFAVELFVEDGELLLNEIAPRVHNVGHLTLEASNVSQFEQHIRAVCGLPLTPVQTLAPAVMCNLLYDDELAGACAAQDDRLNADDVRVHWYGKTEGRPLRKMGHLTALGRTIEEAANLATATYARLTSEPD